MQKRVCRGRNQIFSSFSYCKEFFVPLFVNDPRSGAQGAREKGAPERKKNRRREPKKRFLVNRRRFVRLAVSFSLSTPHNSHPREQGKLVVLFKSCHVQVVFKAP